MFNGWKNYKTWTIATLLQNDEQLYTKILRYQKHIQESNHKGSYKDFIKWSGLSDKSWLSKKVDHDDLDSLVV